jgi:DNA-directed RNA polymerase subunit RPC12/RpoP
MDIFDKLGKKINETTHIVKLNGMIADEENRIAECFRQMGKICFEKYSENPDSSITDFVTQVNEAKSKINDYTEQVKKLKGFYTCEKCGAEIPPNNLFCSGCGAKVEIAQPINDAKNSDGNCASCGVKMPENMAFCTNCGAKVEVKQTSDTQAMAGIVCAGCGVNVAEGLAFCTGCGQKIEQ